MDALRRLLRHEDEAVGLDEAALLVARVEFPGMPVEPWVEELNYHAEQVRRRMGRSFRLAIADYLFGEVGFAGNAEDYYNPHNSCLNRVLETKVGIPITLSVLYMEIGRRLGVDVEGIAAPGHFIVRLEEEDDTYYIDPFQKGKIRDDVPEDVEERFLGAASRRTIAVRMLNNLRMIYLQRQSWGKARQVLDLLLEADPVDADVIRQRAATRAASQMFKGAAEDLETYLKLRPFDPDKDELREQIGRLNRMQSHKN